ncbi:Acyltransferase family protein [compost metagenome]
MSHSHRYQSLDGLRGLAAFTVLISHLTPYGLMNHPESWAVLKWSPLRILWGGHQAVILFFALSGFSLYVMMEKTPISSRGVAGYFAARITRLYPTYIASLIAVGALLWLMKSGFHPGLASIIDHVTMIGEFDSNAINPPIWSIVHEMRISLIFPLVFLCARGWPTGTLAITSSLSVALATLFWVELDTQNVLAAKALSYATTAHYTTIFAFGAVMARYRREILSLLETLSFRLEAHLLALILTAYMYPFDNPWNIGQRFAGDLAIMVGAMGLIAFALRRPGFFGARPVQYLGRISYSLYLVHFGCISAVLWAAGENGSPWMIWGVSIPLSIAAAHLMHVAVERPSQKLSRNVRLKVDAAHGRISGVPFR